MFNPFQVKVGHLPFDDPRVDTLAAFGQSIAGDVPEEPLLQESALFWGHHLTFGDGVAEQAHRVDKAQAIRVDARLQSGLVHDATDHLVGHQQSIECLDHPHGLLAAQGVTGEALMGVDLVDGAFDRPACMLGAGQFQSRSVLGVQHGGHQAVGVAIPWQRRVGAGVGHDPHPERRTGLAPLVVCGLEVRQRGPIGQAVQCFELDVAGQPAQEVRASAPRALRHVKAVKAAVPHPQHPGVDGTQQAPAPQALAGMTRPAASSHEGRRPTCAQLDTLALGEGTVPTRPGVPTTGARVGWGVGHSFGGAVDGHEPQPAQERPAGDGGGHRLADPMQKGHGGSSAQPLAGLADSAPARGHDGRGGPNAPQPLQHFDQHLVQGVLGEQVHRHAPE